MNCKICNSATKPHSYQFKILDEFEAHVHICAQCDFQFFDADWLDKAYTSSLAQLDTGSVRRSINNCFNVSFILNALSQKNPKIVDVGGGAGLTARLLRDLGHDATVTDKYQDNLFCAGFEHIQKNQKVICTAFEVAEHIENPRLFFADLVSTYSPEMIIFSTNIIPDVFDENWWYYTPSTGQHISFYSHKSLDIIASDINYVKYSFKNLHILSRRKLTVLQYYVILLGMQCKYPYLLISKYFRCSWTNIRHDYERVLK